MTDESNNTSPAPATTQKSFWKRGRNLALVSALVIGAGITGAVVTGSVYAQGGPGFGMMGGHGMGMGGGGPRGFMGRDFDPARAEQRVDRMVRHLAVELDATNEQQDKLRSIVGGAAKDLMPMRTQMRDAREKGRTLLTQPNLTRADIEAFRAEQIKTADAASKRLTQALGDVAEVLTPEQRKKLGELMEKRGGKHHGGGPRGGERGGHRGHDRG